MKFGLQYINLLFFWQDNLAEIYLMRRIRGRNKWGRTAAEGSWWVEKRREKQGCDYLSICLQELLNLSKTKDFTNWWRHKMGSSLFPQIKSDEVDLVWKFSQDLREQRGSQAVKGCPAGKETSSPIQHSSSPWMEISQGRKSRDSCTHTYSTLLQAPFPAPTSAKGAQHCQGTWTMKHSSTQAPTPTAQAFGNFRPNPTNPVD